MLPLPDGREASPGGGAGYVEQEFEDYLKCGRLGHGFLRVRCDT